MKKLLLVALLGLLLVNATLFNRRLQTTNVDDQNDSADQNDPADPGNNDALDNDGEGSNNDGTNSNNNNEGGRDEFDSLALEVQTDGGVNVNAGTNNNGVNTGVNTNGGVNTGMMNMQSSNGCQDVTECNSGQLCIEGTCRDTPITTQQTVGCD